MRYPIQMQTRIFSIPAALVITLLAGCASTVSAPVRDGSGVPPAASAVPAEQPGVHTVRPGETLLGIARQYGVTLPDLVGWNNISDPNQITVGQALRVAPPGVDGTAVATAIPIGDGAVATPVPAPGAEAPAAAPLKQGPVGGRQPYSDEAWSKASPSAAPQPTAPPAAVATPDVPKATGSGEWQWPAGGRLIAGYNEASNKGVDIAGNVGDPVLAAAAGKVVYAGSGLRGYGKLVVIKHNQEYNSVYAHNDKLLVKEDDQVTQGQKIAELGSSEADRPKLHFEIRKQGKAVDPMKYLPAR